MSNPQTYRSRKTGAQVPVPEVPAKALVVTPDEVSAVMVSTSDVESRLRMTRSQGKTELCIALLDGFDPSIGKPEAAYGGKSREGWIRQYLSISSVNKAVEHLIESGVVTAVPKHQHRFGGPADLMGFIHRQSNGTTYLLTSEFEIAADRADAQKRNQRRAKLRAEAIEMLCQQHAEELAGIIEAMCSAEGLGMNNESEA